MISSESGLNLNFAHLEASGSMILQKVNLIDHQLQGLLFANVNDNLHLMI